jgi:hypothetical protein
MPSKWQSKPRCNRVPAGQSTVKALAPKPPFVGRTIPPLSTGEVTFASLPNSCQL